eukprot:486702-Pleurochrysis_carterae.AAC.1
MVNYTKTSKGFAYFNGLVVLETTPTVISTFGLSRGHRQSKQGPSAHDDRGRITCVLACSNAVTSVPAVAPTITHKLKPQHDAV